MKRVTGRLMVACAAVLAIGACQDSITVVEPPPPAPPPPPPPPPAGVQPSIQIQQITNPAGNVINPAAAAGQINFVLNVEPGDGNSLQEVRVLLDGVVVGKQTFSGNAVPAGGAGVSANVASSGSASEIIVPFDTRDPNAAGDRYGNTTHTATAEMDHSGGSASAAALDLTFRNANVPGGLAFTGNSAAGPGSATWHGNDDIGAVCTARMYDTAPSSFEIHDDDAEEIDFGDGSGDPMDAPTSVAGDLVVTATATAAKADNDDVEVPTAVDCTLPGTANGWDTDGDGQADIAPQTAYTITKTLRLDNVAPMAPNDTDYYTFKDARTTSPTFGNAVNSWMNGSTVIGLDPDLDDGVQGLVHTLNLAVPVAGGFGVPSSIDVGAEVSTGADIGERSSTVRVLTSALADALGNTTSSSDLLPDNTCDTCSDDLEVDTTPVAFSTARPVGIAVLSPVADVITDFTWVETRSGLEVNNVGLTASGQGFVLDVKRNGSGHPFNLLPPPGDGATSTGSFHEIDAPGVSDPVQGKDGSWTVAGQMADQAGNITPFSFTFDTDVTSPTLNITQAPQDFSVNGAATAPANIAGSFSDANGIAKANVTGYTDPALVAGGPAVCPTPPANYIFQPEGADIDVIDLGTGPSFSAGYTLKVGQRTVGSQYAYGYVTTIWDTSQLISGAMAGNPSNQCANQLGTW